MPELLTICIPTYNRPAYLAECLESILKQSFKDYRVVILDNASEANYGLVLQRFQDSRISYRRHPANLGATGNIQVALREYRDAPHLMVFHDDDLMHPQLLEYEMGILQQQPQVLFAASEMDFFKDGQPFPVERWEGVRGCYEIYHEVAELARALLQGALLNFGSVMYRTSVLEDMSPNYARFSIIWDRPFLMEIARKGKCALIREPLVMYRHHPAQDSATRGLTEDNLVELFRAYRECFPSTWDPASRRLFLTKATNSVLDGYTRLDPAQRSSLHVYVRKCIQKEVFQPLYIRSLGVQALFKAMGLGWLLRVPGLRRVTRRLRRYWHRQGAQDA